MFYVKNNVPDVYINESRDFQLLSSLYDLVLQSSRFSIDSMKHISDTKKCLNVHLPLIGTKVGFFDNLNIPDNVYRIVLRAFPEIIKYKGSLKSIELTVNMFQRFTENDIYILNVDPELADNNSVNIVFTERFDYLDLFYAILDYVKPCGLKISHQFVLTEMFASDTLNINADNINMTDFEAPSSQIYKTSSTDETIIGSATIIGRSIQQEESNI